MRPVHNDWALFRKRPSSSSAHVAAFNGPKGDSSDCKKDENDLGWFKAIRIDVSRDIELQHDTYYASDAQHPSGLLRTVQNKGLEPRPIDIRSGASGNALANK